MFEIIKYDDRFYGRIQTNIFNLYIDTGLASNVFKSHQILDPIEWHIPKPSINLLTTFMMNAALHYNKNKSEIQVFILYDLKTKTYSMYYPNQIVSSAFCQFDYNDVPDGNILVVDIHSHHRMKIGFSSTDDKDDGNFMVPHISCVALGLDEVNLFELDKSVQCRVTVGKDFYDLELDDVFDSSLCDNIYLNQASRITNAVTVAKNSKYTFPFLNNLEKKDDDTAAIDFFNWNSILKEEEKEID